MWDSCMSGGHVFDSMMISLFLCDFFLSVKRSKSGIKEIS